MKQKRIKMTAPKAAKRLSMRALARTLGRSPSHVWRVITGERQSAYLVRRLTALGVEVE